MVKDYIITFENVTKWYPLYNVFSQGFKSFILNFKNSLQNLKKKKVVLNNISFSLEKGECLGILGRNGAGKSTLLGLIAGVLHPNKGKVKVKGKVLPLLELGAGFHPELTGRENIFLNATLLGMTKNKIKERIDDIIKFSELEDYIDQPLRTYSSGMITRLAFSISIFIDSDIILLDEILAVGDFRFQEKSFEKILELKEQGKTIIFVSHNPADIKKLCSKALWLENGKIKMFGNVEQVLESYVEML